MLASSGPVLAAALVVMVPAQPAFAHSQLVKTDPAANATVSTPVTAVTLTFNEMVKQQFSTVVVTGADGVSYSEGTPRSVDRNLTQAVKALPTGKVMVAWRVVSADGHPVEGQFAFMYAVPAPSGAASVSAPASASVSAGAVLVPSAAASIAAPIASRAGTSSGLSGAIRAAIGVALLLVVLAGGWLWWRRRTSGSP
ncbi:copper resistance CopC family protein [Dactylosporangium sp. CA-139066]|uniref:copper resistance CopC family protein n=1 Tax=Dactylosporangium sp. CA-139066 TaxID=3239930 RepID=UPI003D93408D